MRLCAVSSTLLEIPTAEVFVPLLQPARYKGVWGGRGSGKSHFFAERLVEDAVAGHVRAMCLREYQTSIKDSSHQLIQDKIRDLGLGSMFRVTDTEIKGPNGSLFVFLGLQNHTADSLKSKEGFNRGWIDEAHTISADSWKKLTPTFRAPGSEIWCSWNPDKKTDPIDRFFRNEDGSPVTGDPQIISVRANYSDNPWFPDDLRGDMERDKRRDPDKYAHVWLGQYQARSEARVFRNWTVGRLEPPEKARPYFGADWGFSVDPTALVRVWVWDRTLYIDRELVKVGLEIDRTPAAFDTINDERVPNLRAWPIIADSARPETIAYMRAHGYPQMVPARKGPGSREDGVEFLKSYDIVISPDCPKAIDEFTLFAYEIDKKTDEVLPVLEDGHDHIVDSVRYAVEKIRRTPAMTWTPPISVHAPRGLPG